MVVFFVLFFQLPEYLPRPLSFSAAKTKRLELTGNLSRFSLFLSHGSIALFLHRHRHLQRLSIKLFYFCYFTFFLPLSLHSTKILWFGKSTSLWISPGCVCAPVWGLLGLSWKEKDGLAVIYCSLCTKAQCCFLQESLQSFTPQSSPSPFSNDTNTL